MTSTQQGPSGWSPAGSVGGPAGSGGGWWPNRPRRSSADRKIAGVAGGLGRALGIDPVLFRVGFVVLGFFGVGVPLYLAGWLLSAGDEDQVSPGAALLGRGRSAVPPIGAIAMIIGLAVSIGTTLSFGSVVPLVAVGVIAVLVLRRRHSGRPCGGRAWGDGWAHPTPTWPAGNAWSPGGSQQKQQQPGPASPFDSPPFWDDAPSASTARVDLTKHPVDEPTPAAPPAWDPLGVAPFAWDLPEPSTVPATSSAVPVTRDPGVFARVTTGLAFLVGAVFAGGILLGGWSIPWAAVSGAALAVVAVGLLIGSLRGRAQNLIGTGVFLSLVTLALTVSGLQGTGGYGHQQWRPTTVSAVQGQYEVNGGSGNLDLSGLTVPAGQTVTTEVQVHAGQAAVLLPASATVDVTCTSNAGEVDCLGDRKSGLLQRVSRVETGSPDQGTIDLTVHVGAGQAQVRRG